jgi:uncharacterized Zn finger protein
VEGAFLQGKFQIGEEMYMEVPDGMEQYYGSRKDVVLRMLVPIYGTKQAAECFYKELVKRSREKGYERTNADFTLVKLWTKEGRLLVLLFGSTISLHSEQKLTLMPLRLI